MGTANEELRAEEKLPKNLMVEAEDKEVLKSKPSVTERMASFQLNKRQSFALAGGTQTPPALAKSASQQLDADIARLEEENAAMEDRLQLNRRQSFNLAGTHASPHSPEPEETSAVEQKEVAVQPSPPKPSPVEVHPLAKLVESFLTGFCVPCKALAKAE